MSSSTKDTIKNRLINEVVELFIQQISNDEVKNKINTHIVEPSFTYVFDKLYPYIILTTIIFILIFFMLIVILFLFIRR